MWIRRVAAGIAAGAFLAGLQAMAVAASEGSPVVVELFTSQGCSSCPPADLLLARLGEESGGEIVPLAFHIDSWNYLGWTDPFSRAAWTRRQAAYVRALSAEPYTPQAVIAGGVEVLGSDESAIRGAVAEAAARPAAKVSLHVEPAAAELGVSAQVEIPESLRDQKLELMLAVFENGLVTPVQRGENDGRTLRNDYVVRRLERIARLRPGDPVATRHSAAVKIDEDWTRSRLGVAVLLQDPKSLEIRGAAVQTLFAEEGE